MARPSPVKQLTDQLALGPKNWPKAELRPDDSRVWPKIQKMMSRLKIPVTRADADGFVGNYQWDGKAIIASRCDNLLHDLAHYQCAHPIRRFLPDFGLGTAPDSFEKSTLVGVTQEEADFEEACASVLGMLWEIHFGMSFQYTVTYHRWDLDAVAEPQLEFLKKHKLISRGKPCRNLRKS